MNPHVGRCIQAMHRVTEVLHDEFDDLAPPDKSFILQMLLHKIAEEAWNLLKDKGLS